MHLPIQRFFHLKALFWTFEAAFEKPVSMWYQTFHRKSIKRVRQETGYHWIPGFQSWGNMESRKKSFNRIWNLLIILSYLCYTFIHSISLRKYYCFWTTQIYQNLMVSCYFFASYYWIFKVRRHLFKCEVWVIKWKYKRKLE